MIPVVLIFAGAIGYATMGSDIGTTQARKNKGFWFVPDAMRISTASELFSVALSITGMGWALYDVAVRRKKHH